MSRIAPGQPIIVRPSNNVYTALAGVATLASLIAFALVFVKGQQIGFDWFRM